MSKLFPETTGVGHLRYMISPFWNTEFFPVRIVYCGARKRRLREKISFQPPPDVSGHSINAACKILPNEKGG